MIFAILLKILHGVYRSYRSDRAWLLADRDVNHNSSAPETPTSFISSRLRERVRLLNHVERIALELHQMTDRTGSLHDPGQRASQCSCCSIIVNAADESQAPQLLAPLKCPQAANSTFLVNNRQHHHHTDFLTTQLNH